MKSDAMAVSKGLRAWHQGFDKLSPNGWAAAGTPPSPPFALSLSKGLCARHQDVDKLRPNGAWDRSSALEATTPAARNADREPAP